MEKESHKNEGREHAMDGCMVPKTKMLLHIVLLVCTWLHIMTSTFLHYFFGGARYSGGRPVGQLGELSFYSPLSLADVPELLLALSFFHGT